MIQTCKRGGTSRAKGHCGEIDGKCQTFRRGIVAMIKGSKATVETFRMENVAEKLKDKANTKLEVALETLTKAKGILEGELGAVQEKREVLKEKLKKLGKVPEDNPETEAVVRNEVLKISAERDELKLELVKLKQLLAITKAREQSRNPINDGV
ncbi:hypothetical protein GIB67_012608 [Kingdonia uniflora]|uniref:Uncharacterized protein n=1 Tax=Kingdonia uniflora TaxID=39325 RepID=A0A7J7NEQ8_9MAGN|nr:hypothetical protein GIB67_012608 [Kingdonia uniflora]